MLSEIERFVNWVHRRNPAARTWKDYTFDLRQFAALVGDCPPGAVTFREVDRFVDAQRSKGFQPTTINRRLAALVAFYTFLSDEDPDLVCPVVPRRHYLRERERLPRPVQEDNLRAFFAAINETPPPKGEPDNRVRDRAIFILMLRCGLRIGEVAGLQLADLYLREAHPRLVTHGKGSRERSVYLSPQAEKALRAYLKERPAAPCDTIFLSYQKAGLSTTAIHKRLMRYRSVADVSLTAHRLRHSFANDRQVAADYYAACQKLEDWS